MELATRTLGEICDTVGGIIRTGPFGSQLHDSDYVDDGIPVVMPKNIVNGKVSIEDIAHIDETDTQRLAQHQLHIGDIVYGRRGDIGRRALITERENGWLCGTGCLRISLGNKILDPVFLYYYLGQPEVISWIASRAIGATMPNLNTSILRSVEVVYPVLKAQHKIAGILSAYDDLIENNAHRITILEEMTRMLYQEWFVKFRFPGHEKVGMVASEIGMIPEGWKPSTLGILANEVRRGVNPEVIDPETPYFGLEHLPRRSIALSEWGIAKEVQSTKLSFQKDEILFGKIRPYLHKVGVAPLNGVCSSDTIVISTKQEKYFGIVLCCVSSDNFVNHANKTSQGTHMPRANWDILVKYPLMLPPEPLLVLFNETICSFVIAIHNCIFRNRNLRRTRDLLLPKLISGEIDISSWVEDEVGEQEAMAASELRVISKMEPAKSIDVAAMQQRLLWG